MLKTETKKESKMTPRHVNLSDAYPEYKGAPAISREQQIFEDSLLNETDCHKTCRNYEPVETLTQAEVDQIIDSVKDEPKYLNGTRVRWNGMVIGTGKVIEQLAPQIVTIRNNLCPPYDFIIGLDNGEWRSVFTAQLSKLEPTRPPIDWHVGDWAIWTSISSASLPESVLLNLTNSHIGNSWLVDQLSIPTPEQLLVEYKKHKCLAWEYDENRTIKVQFGDNISQLYHSKHRFLIPDCLAVVTYDQWHNRKHWGGKPPEYPKGE